MISTMSHSSPPFSSYIYIYVLLSSTIPPGSSSAMTTTSFSGLVMIGISGGEEIGEFIFNLVFDLAWIKRAAMMMAMMVSVVVGVVSVRKTAAALVFMSIRNLLVFFLLFLLCGRAGGVSKRSPCVCVCVYVLDGDGVKQDLSREKKNGGKGW